MNKKLKQWLDDNTVINSSITRNNTPFADEAILRALGSAGIHAHIDTRDCGNAGNHRGYQYVQDVCISGVAITLVWYPTADGWARAQEDGDESLACNWDNIDLAKLA